MPRWIALISLVALHWKLHWRRIEARLGGSLLAEPRCSECPWQVFSEIAANKRSEDKSLLPPPPMFADFHDRPEDVLNLIKSMLRGI